GRPPAGARVIDVEERTVMPGLFNCHVHLHLDAGPAPLAALADESPEATRAAAGRRAAAMLRRGITTIRDCGARDWSIIALRDAIARGDAQGPRILACGRAICAAGGHALVLGEPVTGEIDAGEAARRQLVAGADFVKAMATGGFGKDGERLDRCELSVGQLRRVAEAAHRAGRRLTVHAYGTEGIRNAIIAGADSVEHGTFVDDETLALLKARSVVLVPTLANTYRVTTEGTQGGVAPYIVATAAAIFPTMLANAGRAHRAGVRLALGTDAGSWLNPHDDIATELQLRVRAGVTPLEALTMATAWSAECLGLADQVGTLQPGKLADIVVLDGDPLEDLAAIERVHAVWKAGRRVGPDHG
ncbi:MAG TPA: amidohydrolase family protein, partial [Candidatus Tectomicrobia bacterium]|nr:amidohydrolase family protein [Candidatus Tectomicrobia bacterium]